MNSPFSNLTIQDNTEIILVSDLFSSDINGGAELTTEAIFENTEYCVQRIYSKDVTMELLEQGYKKFWVFTNFASMDLNHSKLIEYVAKKNKPTFLSTGLGNIEEIGPVIAKNIIEFFQNPRKRELIDELLDRGVSPKDEKIKEILDSPFSGKNVVLTGTLS